LVALFRFLKKYSEKNKRVIEAKEEELVKTNVYQNPFESNFNNQ
jgi:hypothetical protein